MIVKIGGIEIDKASKVEEVNQLRAGLDELGVDGAVEGFKWLNELSVGERYEFAQIVGSHITDSIVSFFTFGLF